MSKGVGNKTEDTCVQKEGTVEIEKGKVEGNRFAKISSNCTYKCSGFMSQ